MPQPRCYFFDHDAGRYVEVAPRGPRRALGAAALVVALAALTAGTAFYRPSVREASVAAERDALQRQLGLAQLRLRAYERDLDALAARDTALYRTILQANPRPLAVAAPATPVPDSFSAQTVRLLRASTLAMARLDGGIRAQRVSYGELAPLASAEAARQTETPALVPAVGTITSGFGMRRHPVLHVHQMHSGVDIVVPVGSSVAAPADGVVKTVGQSSTLGTYVEVEHAAAGVVTVYGHLSRALVRVGQKVKRGDELARSGNSGRSTGPHVHYEVRDLATHAATDPAPFMAAGLSAADYRRLRTQTPETAPAALD